MPIDSPRVVATISGPWPAPVETLLPHQWSYWSFLGKLLSAAKGADAVVLRGTSGFGAGYVEAVAGLLIKLRWRHPPLVLVSDATWDVTSQALEDRLPRFARPLLPRLGRLGVRATDGPHVIYGVLSSDEKQGFEGRWASTGAASASSPFTPRWAVTRPVRPPMGATCSPAATATGTTSCW